MNDPMDLEEMNEDNESSRQEADIPNDNNNDAQDAPDDEGDSSTGEDPPSLEEHNGYSTPDNDAQNNENGTLEPDETYVNSFKFSAGCIKMERVWRNKRGPVPKRWKEQERKEMLVPKKMIEDLNGQTIYPWIRLLLPGQDSHRQYRMGGDGKHLTNAYCDALGFAKGTRNYELLRRYQDPSKIPKEGIAGDLSLVVEYVLEQRISKKHSSLTIGEMNDLLDELADLRGYQGRGRAHHNHQWRQSQSRSYSQGPRGPSTSELRAKWFQKVIKMGLSPLEHKWLVRIILNKMEISVGHISILKWLSPYAPELW